MNYKCIFSEYDTVREHFTEISNEPVIPPIHIVYFVFLKEPRWKTIISGQCKDIINSEIPAYVHVVVSAPSELVQQGVQYINQLFSTYVYGYDIISQTENQYEYPGLHRLYQLAHTLPKDTLFLYFHSKGMVFHNQKGRLYEEEVLTSELLYTWKEYVSVFKNNPQVNKAGLFPGHVPEKANVPDSGFIYWNFFWIRGTYVITLPPPKVPKPNDTNERWQYEVWIGKGTTDDCYSTLYKRTGPTSPQGLHNLKINDYKK
jgi:hypothetical protein